MARKSSEPVFDAADLGSGSYEIPNVGLVLDGTLFDGNDDAAVAAYHGQVDSVPFEEPAPALEVVEPVVVPTGQE